MKSYEAARGLFSLISVMAWIMMGIGGILILLAFGSGGDSYSSRSSEIARLMAAVPGVALVVIGVLTLAMSQLGRATVDTAEYSQQMLQISRETLEVSRQSLRQGDQARSGLEVLADSPTDEPMADFAKGLTGQSPDTASTAPTPPAITYGTMSGVTGLPDGGNPVRLEDDQVGAKLAATYAKSPFDKVT